jgi:hypothetical protein
MTDDKKPREWTVKYFGYSLVADGPTTKLSECVPVIEKSAYDALAKENELLKLDRDNAMAQFFNLQNKASEGIIALEKEMASLRESLSAAIEALELIMSGLSSKGPRPIALEALAKIKGR